MNSDRAKVLHRIVGRSLVGHVAAAAAEAGLKTVVVVHHQEEQVRVDLGEADVGFARQAEARGTGDAVCAALDALPQTGTVVVMAGDAPLLKASTIRSLLAAHGEAKVTVLTARVPTPGHYGRLVRDEAGTPVCIVEAKEASEAELAIDEINTGLYCFDIAWLRGVLPTLQPHAHKQEIFLTDTVQRASSEGGCRVVVHGDVQEVLGVNDRHELGQVRRVLQDRIVEAHARAGVTFVDPGSVVVEHGVRLGTDVLVGIGVVLEGQTEVGNGVRIGHHSVITDAQVASGAVVGPIARLRPGAVLAENSHVGNFCEVKKSTLGAGAKVNHLSYIGDAEIGPGSNIGAGTITCNFDGFSKHPTTIGEGAFIGSNTALVAPVTVGDRAIVAAGSVLTQDVPADAIAVARAEQQNKEGAASRFRARKTRE
jgi:bifunctional UDP-N-acetylglucosamine pyrophosphorylase/glucosamine-1-phosphate N-acetyltransferase